MPSSCSSKGFPAEAVSDLLADAINYALAKYVKHLQLGICLAGAACGIRSPVRDVRGEAGVESRSDGTPAYHKTNLNPEQSEWVAASHGVGRKPGDGRRCYALNPNHLPPSPFVGAPLSFVCEQGLRPLRGLTPASPLTSLRDSSLAVVLTASC